VDGRVSAASVLSDPGYGFGEAALRCARQHRFLPALDPLGRAIAATSPPVHVTFTR
jgi:protein TonB